MPHTAVFRLHMFHLLASLFISTCFASAALAQPALEISTTKLPLADVDRPYLAPVETSEQRDDLVWSIDGRLPPGLKLDRWSGEVSGTPRQAGEYHFSIEVSDSAGRSDSKPFDLQVLDYIKSIEDLPPTPPAYTSPGARSSAAATLSAPMTLQQTAAAGEPDLAGLLDILDAMPEGDWVRANLNFFQDVWAEPDLQPLRGQTVSSPSRIIAAWSSYAWDSRRGDLLAYGGGHANSAGNDVYRWRGTTRMWERASVPSEILWIDPDRKVLTAIDGADAAPASAHTYDNNIYLPIIDRFLTFGGAAVDNGGPYMREDPDSSTGLRNTGPYLFDPSRTGAQRVGGTTGSHVQRVAPYPEITGGQMWENRDVYGNLPANTVLPKSYINGATGYADENGKDVVYVSARDRGRPVQGHVQRHRFTNARSVGKGRAGLERRNSTRCRRL